jgi:hypothetical protein
MLRCYMNTFDHALEKAYAICCLTFVRNNANVVFVCNVRVTRDKNPAPLQQQLHTKGTYVELQYWVCLRWGRIRRVNEADFAEK